MLCILPLFHNYACNKLSIYIGITEMQRPNTIVLLICVCREPRKCIQWAINPLSSKLNKTNKKQHTNSSFELSCVFIIITTIKITTIQVLLRFVGLFLFLFLFLFSSLSINSNKMYCNFIVFFDIHSNYKFTTCVLAFLLASYKPLILLCPN